MTNEQIATMYRGPSCDPLDRLARMLSIRLRLLELAVEEPLLTIAEDAQVQEHANDNLKFFDEESVARLEAEFYGALHRLFTAR